MVGMGDRAKARWSLRSWSLHPTASGRSRAAEGTQRAAPAPSIWHLLRDRLNLGWNVAHNGLVGTVAGTGHGCGELGISTAVAGLVRTGPRGFKWGPGLREEWGSPREKSPSVHDGRKIFWLTYLEVSSGSNPLLSKVHCLDLRPWQGCRQECSRWLSFQVLHLYEP